MVFLGLLLMLEEAAAIEVFETFVGVGEAVDEELLVEHGAVFEEDVGQQAAIFVAGFLVGFEKDADPAVEDELFGEGGRLGAVVHLAVAGVLGFRGVHAPETDPGGGVLRVGDVNIEGVAVNDLDDSSPLAVVAAVILGNRGNFIATRVKLAGAVLLEEDHQSQYQQRQGDEDAAVAVGEDQAGTPWR